MRSGGTAPATAIHVGQLRRCPGGCGTWLYGSRPCATCHALELRRAIARDGHRPRP